MKVRLGLLFLAACIVAPAAWSQDTTGGTEADSSWQQCAQQTQDPSARLACYDRWVDQHGQPALPPPAHVPTPLPPASASAEMPPTPAPMATCRNGPQTPLSKYWELEDGSDCGRFNIRGYKPISLSWIHSSTINRAPSSPTPDHTATSETPYLIQEGRIQLSVRTKIGQGFLPVSGFGGRDSLWFGYTQQSYWQIFTSSISRPFRNTDHQPEFMYILPMPADLPGGWRLRYGGVSLNHQSNGQSLPLSRSWNRAILMAGMEKGERFTLTGRLWNRISDGDEIDDNPDIDKLVGRGELTGSWQVNKDHMLLLTLRHSLTGEPNGSYRLEWLRTLGGQNPNGAGSGLRLHVQLFNGYGDSLVDYNRGRTVLSIGLSLVDW
jgi:phospholipase A1